MYQGVVAVRMSAFCPFIVDPSEIRCTVYRKAVKEKIVRYFYVIDSISQSFQCLQDFLASQKQFSTQQENIIYDLYNGCFNSSPLPFFGIVDGVAGL